jgi:DNA-directed RNA polymerase subunit RPC12/RpoP
MNRKYQCKKCDTIFTEEVSNKFIKTILIKCPNCGSSDIKTNNIINKEVKEFAKKDK